MNFFQKKCELLTDRHTYLQVDRLTYLLTDKVIHRGAQLLKIIPYTIVKTNNNVHSTKKALDFLHKNFFQNIKKYLQQRMKQLKKKFEQRYF